MTNTGETRSAIPTQNRSLAGVHVLVATDSTDERDMFADVFEEYGATVTCVASTVAALTAIRDTRPDAVVYDLDLSVDGGRELVGELRSWSPADGRDTPVIALASCGGEDCGHTADIPCAFVKPVGMATLLATIEDLASAPLRGGSRGSEPRTQSRRPRRRPSRPSARPITARDWTSTSE